MMTGKLARKPVFRGAIGVLVCFVMLAGCQHLPRSADEDPRWIELFDGESLDGWRQVNGEAPYAVFEGAIRGTNVFDSPNSFLATNDVFSDFVLEFESRSIGDANSGVQFRTESAPGTWSGVVGYQLDIDPTERRWTGGIYHEGVHVWRHSMARNAACQAAYEHGAWNSYRIEAVGTVIATWVNGIPCAHMAGAHHATGFVALQVHAIGQADQYLGSYTEWRRLRILNDPLPRDLWRAERSERVEGWLDDQISEIELERGWQAFEFSDGAASLDVGPDGFEIVFDVQVDDVAEGRLDYGFTHAGATCAGRYAILNDVSLAETRPASSLMGSFPAKFEATNLSEPGRPKRIYADERWNRMRIVVTTDRVEHWLNSVKVVDYPSCEPAGREGQLPEMPTRPDQVVLNLVTGNGRIDARNAKYKARSQ